MMQTTRGVILVGHGGIPKDCPSDLVTKLKRLEGPRRQSGQPVSAEEAELDRKIRQWPRNAKTDPYRTGLEALASELRPLLNGALFAVAYNEFCAPTLEEAVADLVEQGVSDIVVITTMFTPGGSHSEVEIPEIIDQLRKQHPGIVLRYAWPFDLNLVAKTLAEQLRRHF
jgi:sirohydrochlorin ferrochelatase